jgi:hypothetical protein
VEPVESGKSEFNRILSDEGFVNRGHNNGALVRGSFVCQDASPMLS